MIGIIGAMHAEVAALIDQMENKREEQISGITFYQGTLQGKEVVLAACGVGKVFAALCAQTMILRYHPHQIIHTGVAGATTEVLPIGGIAVASGLVQHDMDTSPLGDPKGLISGINIVELPTDATLADAFMTLAEDHGFACAKGIIATGDQFVATAADKRALAEEFGAIACEMEGGAIAQVCYVNRTPLCVLRSISDSLTGDAAMEYPAFLALAAKQAVTLILAHLK